MPIKFFAFVLPAVVLCIGCGGAGSNSVASISSSTGGGSSSSSSASSAYVAAYKAASWSSSATVSFPSACTMTITTTGVPPYHADYYLAPVSSEYPTSVAVTPVSQTEMSLVPYTPADITPQSATLNTCPSKAATTTSTNMGVIGFMISGEALFNSYEGNGQQTPALSDNVSYTFTTSAGVTETASFIDTCSSHPTPITVGYQWHHHGVPTCLTNQIDGATGASHLIGIALDGYPIYGGRDMNGNVISVSQLDACNGITSATPEFPSGIYHYVLPIGVTSGRSSLPCYTGTVSSAQVASVARFICGLDAQNKRLQLAARNARRRKLALHLTFKRR